MKIQPHNYLGLMFTAAMRENIFAKQNTIIDDYADEVIGNEAKRDIANILNDDNNRNYLMTVPSLAIAEKIRINEETFDYKIFKGVTTEKKVTILINDSLFFRYIITLKGILCMWVEVTPKTINGIAHQHIQYTTFRISTTIGDVYFPNNDKPFSVPYFKSFIKQLIFLEFSELETVILKPNAKVGTKKQGKYLNGSKQNVVIVDSTWNKIMIRSGEFGVQGHLRMQPYGEGRESAKLIYIDSFTKKGYTRNAKKEINESKQQEIEA